jgi:hypothetical protein
MSTAAVVKAVKTLKFIAETDATMGRGQNMTPVEAMSAATAFITTVRRKALEALEELEPEADDYDPSPYCSYGHMTKASCDCGPIARNE